NWSSGAAPQAADDVIIDPLDRPITVTHSSGAATVKSLHSTQDFVLSGGFLKLLAASAVNGDFTVKNGASLAVQGAGASLAATGPVAIDGASLSLVNGGSISLPDGTTLMNGSLLVDSSAADLSSLVNLSGSSVTLKNGGTADLHNVTNIDGASFLVSG